MAEEWHAPYERLSRQTITMHQALRSLMEELEAVDWYRQRADDCEDAALKDVLLHNMREEIEHASMVLEWLRRTDLDFADAFATYLYSSGPLTEVEERSVSRAPGGNGEATVEEAPPPPPPPRFTIGSLKGGAPWTR
jgi:hypothetical protein